MSPQAANALDRRLEAYEQQSGHQILVYIGQTTGGPPIEDWADRAFQKWKVGRKGMDDGLVLFIMAQDRRLRFEVGYGLEGQVPDSLAGRVIDQIIVPRIRAGDQDGAVASGIDAITEIIGGQVPAQVRGPTGRPSARPLTLGQLIVYCIIGIVLLIVLATNPSLAIWLLMSIMSGGNRRSRGGWGGGDGFGGGGFGGGGGFSGGGGRSGGGG